MPPAGRHATHSSYAPPTSCTVIRRSPTRPTRTLAGHYDERELLDIVFTVGQYHLVSMALNTFGVERDDGVTGVPFPAPS